MGTYEHDHHPSDGAAIARGKPGLGWEQSVGRWQVEGCSIAKSCHSPFTFKNGGC